MKRNPLEGGLRGPCILRLSHSGGETWRSTEVTRREETTHPAASTRTDTRAGGAYAPVSGAVVGDTVVGEVVGDTVGEVGAEVGLTVGQVVSKAVPPKLLIESSWLP